jgi:hypothetical protein
MSTMRPAAAIALLCLAVGAHDGRAQTLRIGQRVRVTAARYRLNSDVATLIAVDDTTLTVAVTRSSGVNRFLDTVALSRTGIDRLDVSRSRTRGTGKGALIGFVSGLVVGAIAGAATYKGEECGPPNPGIGVICVSSGSSRGEDAMAGGFALGLTGAGLGALIGSASHRDHWEGVAVKPLQHGGVGLGLGIRF